MNQSLRLPKPLNTNGAMLKMGYRSTRHPAIEFTGWHNLSVWPIAAQRYQWVPGGGGSTAKVPSIGVEVRNTTDAWKAAITAEQCAAMTETQQLIMQIAGYCPPFFSIRFPDGRRFPAASARC